MAPSSSDNRATTALGAGGRVYEPVASKDTWPASLSKMLRSARSVVLFVSLSIAAILTLVPFAYMISSSLKRRDEIYSVPVTWIPSEIQPLNYVRLFEEIPFAREYLNSAVIAVIVVMSVLFFSSLAGFAFAKYQFRFKNQMFLFVLATMMIPIQVQLVPLYLVVNSLGWLNTYQGVFVPQAMSAFGIFLMRQMMLSVPDEILDAARVDGASEVGLFRHVAIPMTRAGLLVLALLTALTSWNDYLWPVIVLRSEDMLTVPLGLAALINVYRVEYGMVLAGSTLAMLPVVALFVVFNRHFVAGLTSGAVKF